MKDGTMRNCGLFKPGKTGDKFIGSQRRRDVRAMTATHFSPLTLEVGGDTKATCPKSQSWLALGLGLDSSNTHDTPGYHPPQIKIIIFKNTILLSFFFVPE